MTDKQIIIDGVPVQDCLFLSTNKMGDDIGTYCRDFNGSCKNIQNCYFKRWQRKEQECENNKIAYQIELDIYNQECLNLQEELKEVLEQLDQLKAENKHLNDLLNQALKELEKTRETLTEIKEIAITGLEGFCPKCSRKECEDNNCIETAIRDILQKCEVLNDI
jgi:predicted RNase H-like nuclease (RuvC/YqgF family)